MLMNREPVAIATAIRASILCLTAFGLEWTPGQIASLMLAVEAVMALFTRQAVTSESTLVQAGSSKAAVVVEAEKNKAEAAGVPPASPPPQL
jgi:hypothetical protein